MPPVYGVTHADISDELPELFPTGFSAATRPRDTLVTEWIAVADAVVRLRILAVTGEEPDTTDAAADIARQYIISWVKGKVMQAIYEGRAATEVKAASAHYFETADGLLVAIDDLGTQAVGDGTDVGSAFDPSAWSTIKSLRPPTPAIGTGELGTLS